MAMKMIKEKIKEILVCSNKPTNCAGEYTDKCYKCGSVVYLVNKWEDKPNIKKMCSECWKKTRLKGQIRVEKAKEVHK